LSVLRNYYQAYLNELNDIFVGRNEFFASAPSNVDYGDEQDVYEATYSHRIESYEDYNAFCWDQWAEDYGGSKQNSFFGSFYNSSSNLKHKVFEIIDFKTETVSFFGNFYYFNMLRFTVPRLFSWVLFFRLLFFVFLKIRFFFYRIILFFR
jgi:hypothetical protein